MHRDEEVRPFFGEGSEPVGVVPPRSTRQPARLTFEQRAQDRIADGLCPACATELVEDACDRCGWSLLEERMRLRLRAAEDREDYMPRLPLALDEYAPADLDAA